MHKWFARRPGSVFRSLLLSEYNGSEPLQSSYWRAHNLRGIIADPFMGGGTPIIEANRLGFSVIGTDINPMAYWIVRQSIGALDLHDFGASAETVAKVVEATVGGYYVTRCVDCGRTASVKYFLWVKTQECPICGTENDLFPGYLLAEAERHPRQVVVCSECGALNEYDRLPTKAHPAMCRECGISVQVEGPARRNSVRCRQCGAEFRYPPRRPDQPPSHRMWAIEYHCESCKPHHAGRFFKRPDHEDLAKFDAARLALSQASDLPIPGDEIPPGDETDRLHRWGYKHYREMFNERQLLGLGSLLQRIMKVETGETRHALLTVFSDFLRYQNMLCRYDAYALKCQDIFSVHGFPVGLIQCEDSLVGIPGVGAGAFRHFVEKYLRAKRYCEEPFETRYVGTCKQLVPVKGETIRAQLVDAVPTPSSRQALIKAVPAADLPLGEALLDGVFTDPPYFDNVQYAELMDFCFAWLRQGLGPEFSEFRKKTTRASAELTGNVTLGRDLAQFTQGLSAVFRHYAAALRPGAPFVFTYHHNDPIAYVPLVVAILDAGLLCTATLPAPAEMGASLHIARTESSVLDSIFVCRAVDVPEEDDDLSAALAKDIGALKAAGLKIRRGDVRCLLAGHVARLAVSRLRATWSADGPIQRRMESAQACLKGLSLRIESASLESLIADQERLPVG